MWLSKFQYWNKTVPISASTLQGYLPSGSNNLPAVINTSKTESDFSNEREILYKVLFDMKSDLNDLKTLTMELMKSGNVSEVQKDNEGLDPKRFMASPQKENRTEDLEILAIPEKSEDTFDIDEHNQDKYHFAEEIEEEETLSLQDKELETDQKIAGTSSRKAKASRSRIGH